jgi:hypothetical protein
MPIQINL